MVSSPQQTQAQYLAALFAASPDEKLARMVAALETLADETRHDHQYVIVPGDDDILPCPAGVTHIDFKSRRVTTPDPTQVINLNVSQDVLDHVSSFYVFTDNIVQVTAQPGNAPFTLVPFTQFRAPSRRLDYVDISAAEPFSLVFAASADQTPPSTALLADAQFRTSTVTLTKVAASGTADFIGSGSGLAIGAAIPFVAYASRRSLNQALYGVNYINTYGLGQKIFAIRNLTGQAIQADLYGSGFIKTITVLQAPPNNIADPWIEDPDMLNSTGGIPLTIAAGNNGVIESGIPWGAVQLRLRFAAAVAAGTTGSVVVESMAMAPMTR